MSESPFGALRASLAALPQASTLIEIGVLLACTLFAWLLTRIVARAFEGRDADSVMFGRRLVDGVLFPALLLASVDLTRKVLELSLPLNFIRLAIPFLVALLVIRVGVKVLHATLPDTPVVRLLERSISWLAWLALVLWVSGLLPLVMAELDEVGWTVGTSRLSVRKIIEGSITAGLVLIVSLWISSAIERRLLRNAKGSELSWRMAVSNATRALLLFVGLLMALSAVGIDLTALSVLGGAVGVGIGFGLQKLAANYVSGFVILAERSMRIGDTVQVDNFSGVITTINARYTVIRSLSGREAIVPNEQLISNRVENLSLADSKIWLSTVVQVAYDADVDLVMRVLEEAALKQERVLRDPAPGVQLSNFAADGLEFTVGYWIADPENGSGNIRSLVNLEILRLLRNHGIEIPYPQRVLHQAST